jgi:alpha-amylase
MSWADLERDPSAWLGNHMQHLNFTRLKELENDVKLSGKPEFRKIYRMFQISDHFYYMCTKGMGDGSVHEYFSHHGNPFDAGMNYHAAIMDFREKVVRYNTENGKYKEAPADKKAEKQVKR